MLLTSWGDSSDLSCRHNAFSACHQCCQRSAADLQTPSFGPSMSDIAQKNDPGKNAAQKQTYTQCQGIRQIIKYVNDKLRKYENVI